MTPSSTKYNHYKTDHGTFLKQVIGSPEWLNELRLLGYKTFENLRFPTNSRDNEKWKYTNVSPIANGSFRYKFEMDSSSFPKSMLKSILPWQDNWATLVFINGKYSEKLSELDSLSKGYRVSSLSEAFSKNDSIVQPLLGHQAMVDDNGFIAVNTAFLSDGALVVLDANTTNTSPLHLIHITDAGIDPILTHPRNLIQVGSDSRLQVIESYIYTSGSGYFTNAVTEIIASDRASIEHYRYCYESPESFHIGQTKVNVYQDASFKSTSFSTGAAVARNDLEVKLVETGASCTLGGLYVTNRNKHVDNNINIEHLQQDTKSAQYFKGILDENSRGVFNGRVVVHRDAQKSIATQTDKNLLLSKGARINTKPSLEIYADDVQCSHGATAGTFADEAIYYMCSRGINPETARRLLIQGFASEIIDLVQLKPLRDHTDLLLRKGLLI